MNLDEARAELGVDLGADDDTIRRAYLRLLKKRKPEVDPEGFRKLRDAYELLREAHAVAELEALAARATAAPAEPRPSSPAPARDAPPGEPVDPTASQSVGELLSREDFDAALELAQARLTHALRHQAGERRYIEGPAILALVLILYSKGSDARARQLTWKLHEWLQATGVEARLLGPEGSAIWGLTRELGELPPAFPDDVRRALARALLEGEPSAAVEALDTYRRQEGPASLDLLGVQLRKHAPLLHAVYGAVFAPREVHAPPAEPPKRRWSGWSYVGIVLALASVRVCTSLEERIPPMAPKPYDPNVTFAVARDAAAATTNAPAIPPASNPSAAIPPAFVQPRALALALSYSADQEGAFDLGAQARGVAQRLASGECADLAGRLGEMVKTFGALPANKRAGLRMPLHVMRRSIADACGIELKELP